LNLARWGSWWDSQVQGGGKHLSQAGDHRQLPVQAKIGTMIQKVQKRSALAALVLVIATTVALAVLPANEIMALRRTALNVFVQPGVIVWWLVMAGPNQFSPTTYAGYEAIVVANTGCWLQAMWFMFNVASGAVTRRWYAIAAPVLTMASLAIVVMRESNKMIPSVWPSPPSPTPGSGRSSSGSSWSPWGSCAGRSPSPAPDRNGAHDHLALTLAGRGTWWPQGGPGGNQPVLDAVRLGFTPGRYRGRPPVVSALNVKRHFLTYSD